MPQRSVGVVLSPMVFGDSRSFQLHAGALLREGHPVQTIDLFKGVKHPLPFPWRADRIAYGLNERKEELVEAVFTAVGHLQQQCERVALMGFGYGAILSLWYAEAVRDSPVIGWYPHLIFPEKAANAQPPDPWLVTGPVWLFYGDGDKVIPDSLRRAKHLAERRGNVKVKTFSRAGHAFADANIAGRLPSPLYRRTPAEESMAEALTYLGELER
jgi:dienelactone hydrolase